MAGRVVDGALFWTIPDELSKRFRPFDEARAARARAERAPLPLSSRARRIALFPVSVPPPSPPTAAQIAPVRRREQPSRRGRRELR